MESNESGKAANPAEFASHRYYVDAKTAEKRIAELERQLSKITDIEKLAHLEHDQWIYWSKAVASEVSSERRERWEQFWVPYDELDDEVKEYDRKWARLIAALAR